MNENSSEFMNVPIDYKFTDEDIEIGEDILCLVTSYEEPPYFIVMQRKVNGMYSKCI